MADIQPEWSVSHEPLHVNVKQAVPFFWVMNMEESLRFYIDGLGFAIKNKWEPRGTIEWCWLGVGNAAIMLQEYRKDEGEKSIPKEKRGQGVSVCFICEDALIIYKDALAKGLQPTEPFVGNNMWVTGFTDPDGYALFFESMTDVAEGTRYSEWSDGS